MGKRKDFNDFRFSGLNYNSISNNYYSMKRVNEEENKIVIKVGDAHLIETKFGYALILNYDHVVFLKEWQVDKNYFGNEVILTKEYFIPKKWGEHTEFTDEEENLKFDTWLKVAKEQQDFGNIVKWAK